ncbi:hypothetical protein M501DRAFT_219620 [Patellaria atrata CBS 101060]|uniref:Uncharacterized protein n=1 Tax=Patellaria atrata CBS 101060 TaxID=1346257 RepID=A0A9P4VL43_9PEZI|nr:hypothetical protein M501DRAFT_219620 [Patellaria atrata CBS 101060]
MITGREDEDLTSFFKLENEVMNKIGALREDSESPAAARSTNATAEKIKALGKKAAETLAAVLSSTERYKELRKDAEDLLDQARNIKTIRGILKQRGDSTTLFRYMFVTSEWEKVDESQKALTDKLDFLQGEDGLVAGIERARNKHRTESERLQEEIRLLQESQSGNITGADCY